MVMIIRLQSVLRFLRETWEMFYWALWCPSKLQQRMNEWSPKLDYSNTRFIDILHFRLNTRFFFQFLLLILILNLPLFSALSELQGFILIVSNLIVAYGLALLVLPWSISFPILVSIVYTYNPIQFTGKLESTWQIYTKTLPSLPQIAIGVTIFAFILGVTVSSIYALLQKQKVNSARNVLVFGDSLGAGIGSWLVIQDLWITFTIVTITGLISISVRNELDSSHSVGDVVFITAFVVASTITFVVTFFIANAVAEVNAVTNVITFAVAFVVVLVAAFVVADITLVGMALVVSVFVTLVVSVFVTTVMVAIASLPIVNFLIFSWIVSLCVASLQNHWAGVITAGALVALEFERFGIATLLVTPIFLLGYSHAFPDYFFATSSLTVIRFRLLPWKPNSLQILRKLPPYTSEYLWFPLPNHDRLLVAAFQTDLSEALAIFQNIQSQTLPGFQRTIKKALPQLVADQFASIRDRASLTQTATSKHPILPFLVPRFYSSEPESIQPFNPELETLVPRLQAIAIDVSKALEASISALRERGLENALTKLNTLSGQMPGLGLKQPQIQRWQPVFDRWRTIIELEIAEQQKFSQGELLNPFQFGNPLRRDSADLFKGRTKFSEQILRLVLDRNRPTLVLHGARRSGKSSFLLNLPRLLPSDLIPIYLDLQRQGTTNSDADFLYSLAKAIRDDCRAQGIRLPTLPDRPAFYQNPYPLLEDWLDDAFENFRDRRILLNLDEFEKIGGAIAQGRITLRLFDELRSLIQHSNQLAFLFSGVQTLDELGPNWSSYFISIVPIEMSYLEPHEAEQLLTNPDPEFELGYAPGIVEEILTLTHCQPYLLQLIGWTLVNQANLRQVRVVDRSLLQTAIQDSFTQGEPYFTNLWTEFTGTTLSERAAGQAALIAIAHNQPIPNPNDSATQAALTRLHRYHILKNNAFEVPLVEQWVRDRAILTEL